MKKNAADGMEQERRATVSDVAKAAGVSVASVSRVLNNTGRVGPETRERIMRIAAELAYVPNVAARSLALRRSRMIGAVVPSLENLNFATAVDACRKALRQAGYTLLIADANYDQNKEEEQVKALVAHGIDAIMLIGRAHNAGVLSFLRARNVPLLLTWTSDLPSSAEKGAQLPAIGFDNGQATRQALEYLLDLGHSRFGVIAGEIEHSDRAAARVNMVREVLRQRGLGPAQEVFSQRPHLLSEGKEGFESIMSAAEPPTAVLCMNDVLAYGAFIGARELGLRIPDDVSVVGFDDLDFAPALEPPLTTVRVPAREIGEEAGKYVVRMLEGNAAEPPVIAAQLIVRGSAAAPARKERIA